MNLANQLDSRRQRFWLIAVALGLGSLFAAFAVLWSTGPASAQAGASWTQLGQDIEGQAVGDESGTAVAVSADGNTVVIGSPESNANGGSSGSANVYRLNGNTWNQLGQAINGENPFDDFGESVAIAANGNTVIIGAPGNDDAGSGAGHARVYRLTGNTWNQLGTDIDGEASNDRSGDAVAMSANGNTVVIGAPLNDGNGNLSGHARVYQLNGNTWNQLGADIDGEDAVDFAGDSVAMSNNGNTIILGAPGNGGQSNSGVARIYRLSGTNWNQLGQDLDGETFLGSFGESVSMSGNGNTIAVGDPGSNDNGTDSGQVQAYRLSGNTWNQLGQDINGENADDESGTSVAMSDDGNTIIVGSPNNDDNGTNSGHSRVFELVGATWTQVGADIQGQSAGDRSGTSVAMSDDGNTVAVGSPFDDDNGTNAGDVRVFRLLSPAGLCNGLPVTVNIGAGEAPTNGADVILGTAGPDVIIGLAGNDTICGLGGNDTINSGAGSDWVDAGNGNDSVFGLDGNDVIFGGAGNDQIVAGNGADFVDGGGGADVLNGGPGNDNMNGRAGNDQLFGQGGNDVLNGGNDDDLVVGVDGSDTVSGGNGDDTVNGGSGDDTVNGDADNDLVFGLTGDDTVNGGNGNDSLFGQIGNDILNGGAGNDELLGNQGNDIMTDPSGTNVFNGGPGNDTLTGGTGNDTMFGDGDNSQAGNDTIAGGSGNDVLIGFAGADTLTSTDGIVDTVNGGPGVDACTTDGIDTVFNCP